MQNNTSTIQNIFAMIRRNPVIFGFVAVVIIFVIFFVISLSSNKKTSTTTNRTETTNRTNTTNTESTLPTENVQPTAEVVQSEPTAEKEEGPQAELNAEEKESVWSKVDFQPTDLNGMNAQKTTLPDGTDQYAYTTDNPKRSDEIRVKNGIIIFQRNSVYNETITDYLGFLKEPEYTAVGSAFYGPDAVTYIYLEKGTAFVANQTSKQVYEQYTFQPVSIADFKRLYGDDITGEIKRAKGDLKS